MDKYSKNAKLNKLFCTIEKELLQMRNTATESLAEIKHYYDNHKAHLDYNIVTYGNMRTCYDDVRELYASAGYKVANYTNECLWYNYMRHVGYVVYQLMKN